jgi:hypothetical protein
VSQAGLAAVSQQALLQVSPSQHEPQSLPQQLAQLTAQQAQSQQAAEAAMSLALFEVPARPVSMKKVIRNVMWFFRRRLNELRSNVKSMAAGRPHAWLQSTVQPARKRHQRRRWRGSGEADQPHDSRTNGNSFGHRHRRHDGRRIRTIATILQQRRSVIGVDVTVAATSWGVLRLRRLETRTAAAGYRLFDLVHVIEHAKRLTNAPQACTAHQHRQRRCEEQETEETVPH